ncbi:CCA tRNA nucleotidyltransferase, mitochondrial [Erysiphe neolycopersici]|uniref:CCA tRNA nucleotidyltransferase, mitochondrial n=1 Tax=Erysiphe neolycopersici TaxID=212602 RepID=A0A420HF08_9PEZI|nr:CCA tRNA nucleotidyltransferase, mitochondrial [Erysiphe neolycopersici]
MVLKKNKAVCGYLLALVNRRATFRTFSYHSMKHSVLETDDFEKSKKPKLTMSTAKISLTTSENNLKVFLLDVVKAFEEENKSQEQLILRFAGGWVRDKLLDIPSNDIDVAINSMTGSAFTEKVQRFLKDNANLEKHHLSALDVGRCYQTAANPEKSKHLETSTMTIMGYDIDFVNLRKETYSLESRNPVMEFGTAEEDALRRDCTINSLFYNIHTDEVEDYACGLNDLTEKRIKTPLEPKITFMDDPLRILRLIRFANRLNFTIDPTCEAYINDPEVMNAFHRKITRERVQVEVFKMLKGQNPHGALQYFDRLGLYNEIFTDTGAKQIPIPDVKNWWRAYSCLQELILETSLYQTLLPSHVETAWLLAAYTPWSTVQELPNFYGKARLAWGAEAARLALKAENKKINLISDSLKHFKEVINLKESILRADDWVKHRDIVGNLIRRMDQQGHWRLQVVFAILVEAMGDQHITKANQFERPLDSWKKFIRHLEEMDLMNPSSIKNLVDGKILAEVFGLKPGKWVAPVLEFCMNWTLRNPDVNDRTEVIEEVKKKRHELGIPPS